jgi:anti-sigma B factor antagonist
MLMSHRPANTTPCTGDLRVVIERRGTVAVVKLVGSAHMDASGNLREQLVGLVDEQTTTIVLDLTELDFINSVGLGAIIAAYLRCRRYNGAIKLVAPKPAIRDLLSLTKLTNLFPVHPSVDNALAVN